MAYTPLATPSNLVSTPLAEVVRNFSTQEVTNLLARSSRAVESYCGRRLSPFTLTESQRAQMVDPDEQVDAYTPLDTIGMLGLSRAQSLGASELVRHFWVRQKPPVWEDQWVGAISSVVILRSFSGSQTVSPNALQFESDTGHVRLAFGTYVPQGSTIVSTYSGGYNPVPDDLVQATILQATELALLDLEPQARPDIDFAALRSAISTLLSPYVAD